MSRRQSETKQLAEALAPFLAEHYDATGVDLCEAAVGDQLLMRLLDAYVELPATIEEAELRAIEATRAGADAQALRARTAARKADRLLFDTTEAVRYRLRRLAAR